MTFRRAAVLLALSILAACGVKAPPRPPEREAHGAVPAPEASAACEDRCGGGSTPTSTPTSTSTSTSKR